MPTHFASNAEKEGKKKKDANDICFSKMARRTAAINM